MIYKDLRVWQLSRNLVKEIYEITKNFPVEERYGLQSQIRRCAVSIPSNLAEGNARNSKDQYKYHVNVARGSLAELETQIYLSFDLGFISEEIHIQLLGMTDEIDRMIYGLLKSLS